MADAAPDRDDLVTRRARIMVARFSRTIAEYLQFVEMLGLAPGSEDLFRTEVTLQKLRDWSGPTGKNKEPK